MLLLNNCNENIPNAGVTNGQIPGVISDSEITLTTNVPCVLETEQLDKLKDKSHEWLLNGRTAKYKAIGYAYVWFHGAKLNPSYLEQSFKGFVNRSKNADYRNSLKFCFNLPDGQKDSSLTKYAKVMRVIEQQLGVDDIDLTAPAIFVERIVELIGQRGGLDKLSEEEALYAPRSGKNSEQTKGDDNNLSKQSIDDQETSEEDVVESELDEHETEPEPDRNVVGIGAGTVQKPKATRENLDTRMRAYLKATPVANFKAHNKLESASGLVIAIGVQEGDIVNVVDLLADQDVLKAVIKSTGRVSSNVNNAQGQP